MFIPIRTDTPLRSTPYMNWVLIVANLAAFTVQTILPRSATANFLLDPRDPHLYQFITYQFLHGNGLHILGNLLFLYIFGNNVNDRMGQWGYLGFYLAGGVFAGIAHVMFSSHPVLGASGSIAAVTGAYLVLLPRSNITVVYFFYLIGKIEVPGMWFVLAFFAQDIFSQVFANAFGGQAAVAHMAHIGGTLFGIAVCLAMLGTRLLPRDIFDLFGILDRWNRRRQHRDAVRQGYDPFGFAPPTPADPRRAKIDPNLDRIHDLRAAIGDALAKHDTTEAVKKFLELRAIDPQQVLPKQSQLDVANQLFADGTHAAAADAYERYLQYYPTAEQTENVRLILGIIYSRYLQQYGKAKQHLEAALPKLHADRDIELAKTELAKVEPLLRPA